MPMVNEQSNRLVCRDLTQQFRRRRREKQQANHQELSRHGDLGSQLLHNPSGPEAMLGADGGPSSPSVSRGGEAPSLPPQWVDFSDKAREDIKETEAQLVKLVKTQQKRLLRPFDAGGGLESEIQALTGSSGDLIRSCEHSIFQVRTAAQGEDSCMDDEFRHNVQRSLAAQLQQVSGQVHKAQKDYLKDMRRRQQLQEQLQRQDSYDVESGRPRQWWPSCLHGVATATGGDGRDCSHKEFRNIADRCISHRAASDFQAHGKPCC